MENVNALHEEMTTLARTKCATLQRRLDEARDSWNLAILYRDDDANSAGMFLNNRRISPTSRTVDYYDGDLHGDDAPGVVFFCCKTGYDGSLLQKSQYPVNYKGEKTRTVIPARHILNDERLRMFFVNYTQFNYKDHSICQVHILFVFNDHESIEYCRAKFVELDPKDNGILERNEDDWKHRCLLSSKNEKNVVLYINVCYAHEVVFTKPVERHCEDYTKTADFPPYYCSV